MRKIKTLELFIKGQQVFSEPTKGKNQLNISLYISDSSTSDQLEAEIKQLHGEENMFYRSPNINNPTWYNCACIWEGGKESKAFFILPNDKITCRKYAREGLIYLVTSFSAEYALDQLDSDEIDETIANNISSLTACLSSKILGCVFDTIDDGIYI